MGDPVRQTRAQIEADLPPEIRALPRHERWKGVQREVAQLPPHQNHTERRMAQHLIWRRWGV